MKVSTGLILRVVAIAFATSFLAGCAPQFVDIKPEPKSLAWVERPAQIKSNQIGTSDSKEVVLTERPVNLLSAEERVRWVAGVDLSSSKLQRSQERIGRGSNELSEGRSKGQGGAPVTIYQFGISGDQLSVEGRLTLEKFKATKSDRFYVEFLNRDSMNEESINSMMIAWKMLSSTLKEKGLAMSGVVLGGAKYDQNSNAIVLVKVGK